MEFQQLGEKERKILLLALDIDVNNLKCRYCKEKVNHKDCSIMPSVKGDKNATITCGSPLCISEYLNDLEPKECCEQTAKEIFDEIDEDKMLKNYKGAMTEAVRVGIKLAKAKIQKFIKQ